MKKDYFPIKGFLPVTLLDWPGKIAAMIFVSGCNFRCQFCYNTELVLHPGKIPEISQEKIFKHLLIKKKWIDGLVISGGEPTLHKGLIDFCQEVKNLGYKIQIQTNGTNPEVLQKLIDKKLIDCLAMDIKAPFEKYELITQTKVNTKNIAKSIQIIEKNPQIEAEFRTTIIPKFLTKNDIIKISKMLSKNKRPYFIQQFQNKKTLNKKLIGTNSYLNKDLEKIIKSAQKYKKEIKLRGV